MERLLRFPGPKGITQEIYTTPVTSAEPLRMLASGFVTGDSGMGHIALTSTRPTRIRGYFDTVFDARLTDYIDETISGVKLKIRFLRVNERHHSIAVAATRGLPIDPVRTRVQHLNIQAATLDDVARSYLRVHELGFGMALSVGRRHQRQGTVVLRPYSLGVRVGGRLEPDRHRRDDLGTRHPPGHQHLGSPSRRPDRRGPARPVPRGRPLPGAPREHGARPQRSGDRRRLTRYGHAPRARRGNVP